MTALYVCDKCEYRTTRKSSYNKHMVSLKHKNRENNIGEFGCELCNKQYKYSSGLANHKKKCLIVASMAEQSKQIKNLCALLEQSVAQNAETLNKIMPNITNNIGKMTINVFLKDHCKDAMNFVDFVENIKYTLDDLYYTMDNGYERGISNVLVKSLTEIPACERPIYCSDRKRMQFYVKDDNAWGKDADNMTINKGIDHITRKQISAIKTWEDANPGWDDNPTLTEEYLRIVKAIMSGDDNSNEHIHRQIGSESEWQKNLSLLK